MVTLDMSIEDESRRMENTLRLATCSDLRRRILVSLRAGKKPLSGLREELKVSSTTAIHALRELESEKLVFQDVDRGYALTKIGEIVALKLTDFMDAIEVLKMHEDFWLTHDLSGIPPQLLEKIGWLKGSTLLEAPATDFFRVHTEYINMIRTAKEIRGVSSLFIPEFSSLFENLVVDKKMDVKLVVTKEVLKKILEIADQDLLKRVLSDKRFKLRLYMMKEDKKIGLTVTNEFLSLGLFNLDGSYDWNKDLISSNQKAIAWGHELFKYYAKNSKSVRL